ncbi:phenylalanine--tRNA ligase subunit beta [Lacticaseibacillus zhaodongensis]|uniref:phenylalanine--tRNA ligase subunit beta n=1 Tax=Lacticaseibacillus zhaodongensis TaxID=2668065 RepID=UPI0012D2D92D|nr:phenylalanine--tRNA ligase subunit beta [Lacticaseibacillus zhaodongensis]
MDVSYEWLKELVDVPVTPEELADKVSRTGIEVPSVTYRGAGMKKLVIGHIESEVMHPNSDHLHICQVDVGEDELRQIICGAPNVAAGQTVVAALPGARIANNVKIKRGKIRGEVSDGMLCALQEIGFSDSVAPHKYSDGIYVFDEAIKPGTDAMDVLGMNDAVLDFDITPNRADILGMRGTAWEVGATYGNKPHFEEKHLVEGSQKTADMLKVSVTDPKDAPSYNLRVVTGVKIQDSPLWMQKRLWNAGVRPINNIVDITNYIMLYFGQPLHAFDYDKLDNKEILVRRATDGEKLTTLDGNDHELVSDDIVITDGDKPVALAGVMGGLNSEITKDTTTVVFEAATFNHINIRKTAQRYNLRSQASIRFERGIDLASIVPALNEAARLAGELGGGTATAGVITGSSVSADPVVIDISLNRINKILGTQISAVAVSKIFDQLGFGVQEQASADDVIFTVSVPARRWDISIVPDLIEEVARIYGYDQLPSTLPTTSQTVGTLTTVQERVRRSRKLLEAMGMDQAITYALRREGDNKHFILEPGETTKLAWPMTVDHQELRQNMLSGLLDAVKYNVAHGTADIALYEQGRTFIRHAGHDRPAEHEYLAGVFSGSMQQDSWNQKAKPVDFFTVKGIVSALLDDFDIAGNIEFAATDLDSALHPGQGASIYLDGERIGLLGRLHPEFEHEEGLPATFVFELNLEPLFVADRNVKIAVPAPKFPGVTRDVALLIADNVTDQQVLDVIKANGGKYLQSARLFDVYAGPKLPAGTKSLAYTLTYLNPEATLTDETVSASFAKVTAALESELKAHIR